MIVRVAAPPVDGRATEEARRAVADRLGVPRSAVVLRSGERARVKVFDVAGLTEAQVEAQIVPESDERFSLELGGQGLR